MTCDRSFLAKLRRLTVPVCGGSEGSSPLGADLAPHTCIRSVRWDPDHDAVMRIGGKAPGGGPILSVGISAMFEYGFPPPRIVNSAVRLKSQREHRMVLSGVFVPASPFRTLDVRRRLPAARQW